MYAVIFCGGKQHKVSEGDVLSVELLDAQAGSDIELDKVLLVSDGTNIKVGAPYLDGAKVTAKVLGAHGGEKVKIVKFRRRKHHQKVLAIVSGLPIYRLLVFSSNLVRRKE